MFINEYGDKKDPIVLLLAPMMVSGEDLYQLMHPYFKHNYHFMAPDQGGHGKAGAYISADEEYKTLKTFCLTGDIERSNWFMEHPWVLRSDTDSSWIRILRSIMPGLTVWRSAGMPLFPSGL